MTTQATANKIKRSFTISPESLAFLQEARQERQAGSDSETLELLLGELMLKRKLRKIETAYTDYYDSVSDEQLVEDQEWARMAGPNVLNRVEP